MSRSEPSNSANTGPYEPLGGLRILTVGTVRGLLSGHSMKRSPKPVDKHVGSRVRMRRLMLDMSQEKLGSALGLTFQQVQKYEKGTNRIGASRLQHISHIFQVPVAFFFDGAPSMPGHHAAPGMAEAPTPAYVSEFLSTNDGL